jgi:hypothetical protein
VVGISVSGIGERTPGKRQGWVNAKCNTDRRTADPWRKVSRQQGFKS